MKQEIMRLSEDVIEKYLKEVNGGNADAYLVQDTQTIMNLVSKEEKQAQDAGFKKDELENEKKKIELEEKKLEFEKKKEDNSRKETEDKIKLDKEKLEIEKAKIEVEKAKIEANKEAEKAKIEVEKAKIEANKEVEKAKIELEVKHLEVTSKQETNKSRNGLIVGIAGAAATVLTIGGSIIVQKLKDKHEMERSVMEQNALADRVSEIIKSERNEDRIFTGFSKIELQNDIK